MAKETILIGSKLPFGLTIKDPTDKTENAKKEVILGLNSSKIIGATHMVSEIDADLWATFKVAYPDFVPLKKGAIFEAKNRTEVEAKAREREKEKTGLEQLDPSKHGVKKADEEDPK